MVVSLNMERIVLMMDASLKQAAGNNRSAGADQALSDWAEAVRGGEKLTEDEFRRYYHGYARVAYYKHFPDAPKPDRTSIHLQRDIADDVQVIGKMIEEIDPELKNLKPNRGGTYNRTLIITLALLRAADKKSKAA